MVYVVWIGIVGIVLLLMVTGFKKWGAESERRKKSEKIVKDLERDAKINSRSNVSDPLDRM